MVASGCMMKDVSRRAFLSGIAANILAIIAGTLFLLVKPGARFRGMEPEAQVSVLLCILAVALGLFWTLPLACCTLWQKRFVPGVLAVGLSLSPWWAWTMMLVLAERINAVEFD